MFLNLDKGVLSGTTQLGGTSTEDILVNAAHITGVDKNSQTFHLAGGKSFKVISATSKDKIEITFPVAADGTNDELFINSFAGSTNASFLLETGTSTGNQISFRGNDTLGSTGNVHVRLPFDQAVNTTLTSQLDEMVKVFNELPTIYETALDVANNGVNVVQRNSVARRDGNKLVIEKLTFEVSAAISLGGVTAWPTAPTISDTTYTVPSVSVAVFEAMQNSNRSDSIDIFDMNSSGEVTLSGPSTI